MIGFLTGRAMRGKFGRLLAGGVLALGMASLAASTAFAAEMTEAREIEVGDELAISMLAGAKLLNQDAAQEYVNHVGRWLTTVTERPDLPWQFGIMDRAEVGAYPLPGGKVLLTVGMLRKLKDEAELAGVLAHEIAHVVARHQLSSIAAAEPGQGSLGAITTALNPDLEFEADRMAVVIMARAGYDAAAYLNVLRTLQNDRSNDPGLGLLVSVHPPFKDRMAHVQTMVQALPKAQVSAGSDKSRARFKTLQDTLKAAARK